MKQFRCRIVSEGWMTVCTEQQDFVFAVDEKHAREIICSRWHIRRNAKGLRIEEIPFVTAERIALTKTELISETSYRCGLGTWDSSHYGEVTRHYCSKCKKEINEIDQLCNNCGAYFIK